MAETSWLQAIVLWFSVLFIATTIGLLALYTVFMSYFNAKITNGFLANRERVFKEQEKAKAGAKDNKETAKEAGTSASAGSEQDKEDAPYIIAGFFHPYWYEPTKFATSSNLNCMIYQLI